MRRGGVKVTREIKISLVICTYMRPKQLHTILDTLREEKARNEWEDWLKVIVIDNASEIKEETESGNGIYIYHNSNTGGSGGFARGMEETLISMDVFPATHVVLMDDDVILQVESLYRLRALLSLMKEEYAQEMVAGRMFCIDRPHIQYTAVEIWNKGDIRHIGWNQNMADKQSLWSMNENKCGEYGGWWFACFPIEFVKENRPLPFFLHCDDVEYGLRHGGTPIILNGIQVWHESHEYRKSYIIEYYDLRNSLIVNSIYEFLDYDEKLEKNWIERISKYHKEKNWQWELAVILGMNDFLKGTVWLKECNGAYIHSLLLHLPGCRWINMLMWRIVRVKLRIYIKKMRKKRYISKSEDKIYNLNR